MKMQNLKITIICLISCSYAFSIDALASSKKHSATENISSKKNREFEKANSEKYSATEEDGTAKIIHAGTAAEKNNIIDEELDSLRPTKITKKQPEPKHITASVKTKETFIESSNFDSVPSEHVDEIAERIKYAYDILKRFGRAYDYRVVTLAEFRKILEDLENKNQGA